MKKRNYLKITIKEHGETNVQCLMLKEVHFVTTLLKDSEKGKGTVELIECTQKEYDDLFAY